MIKINSKTNKNNVKKLIDIEIASLNASLNFQKALSRQILLFLKNFIGNIEIESILPNDINNFISDATLNLNKINSNIDSYTNLLEILDNLKFNIYTLDFKNLSSKINQYNSKNETIISEITSSNSNIQKFILSMNSIDISEYISVEDLDNVIKPDIYNNLPNSNIIADPTPKSLTQKHFIPLIENTLVISQKDEKVILPYKIGKLKKILKQNPHKYISLSDIVEQLYTKPIKNYKFTAVARFKEAYKLIIEKEHGTKKDALKLASELFSNYNLHPAIITACKNLNELDIYLSCLEYNELEDFHFFKIVYEALPTVVKPKYNVKNKCAN